MARRIVNTKELHSCTETSHCWFCYEEWMFSHRRTDATYILKFTVLVFFSTWKWWPTYHNKPNHSHGLLLQQTGGPSWKAFPGRPVETLKINQFFLFYKTAPSRIQIASNWPTNWQDFSNKSTFKKAKTSQKENQYLLFSFANICWTIQAAIILSLRTISCLKEIYDLFQFLHRHYRLSHPFIHSTLGLLLFTASDLWPLLSQCDPLPYHCLALVKVRAVCCCCLVT